MRINRALLAGLLLLSAAASAAPWSSRWTVAGRSWNEQFTAPYTVNEASSPKQVSAQAVVSGQTITVATSGTITRTSGSYVTDGYLVGQTIKLSGSATTPSNNGTFTVTAVSALALAIVTGSLALTSESSTALVVSGQPRTSQGLLIWHTSTAAQFTGSARNTEVQMDIQPSAGAAANALVLRTNWTLTLAEEVGLGLAAYPYHVQFVAPSDSNVNPLGSQLDIYFADATEWTVVLAAASSWIIDFGGCNSTCQSGL